MTPNILYFTNKEPKGDCNKIYYKLDLQKKEIRFIFSEPKALWRKLSPLSYKEYRCQLTSSKYYIPLTEEEMFLEML